jgi:hypothetical protein
MTTTAVTKTCPPWCVEDERQDDTTLDRCHPDDFITWHNGPKRPIPGGVVELRLFDPDVLDEGESFEPELHIAGSDIEGGYSLRIPARDAETLARAILEAIEVAQG